MHPGGDIIASKTREIEGNSVDVVVVVTGATAKPLSKLLP